MASEPLEGFQEVNLASPTTPDVHAITEAQAQTCSAKPSTLYCTHSLTSAPCPPTTLYVDHLPTQPVYPAPRDPDIDEVQTGSGSALEAAASCSCQEDHLDGEEPLGQDSDGPVKIRSPSVLEVREKGSERLKEELAKAQREAHKMVREANMKQVSAEKQLKEALGKIDVLQAEVAALKTLVLSTSPTSPCKEMPSGVKVAYKKGHVRNKSTSSAMMGSHQELNYSSVTNDSKEVDSVLFNEFKMWKEEPTLDSSCCFLDRIYREDIYPCLTFCKTELIVGDVEEACLVPELKNSKLAAAVLEAVERNTLSVEPVGFQPLPVVKASAMECGGPKKCALSGQTKTCKHRIKLGDSSNYYYISPFCRYRITSVCNFFTYIRYIHQGLVKQQDAEQMFWEVMQLRKEMSYAKLGYYRDEL